MKVTNTNQAPAAIGPYSQAISHGDFLFISGQLPVDPTTGAFAGDTIEAQAAQSVANVGAILRANGIDFENVIKTTCFLANMEDFGTFNGVYAKAFTGNPARSCVAVKDLPKNALCEIEAIAVLK